MPVRRALTLTIVIAISLCCAAQQSEHGRAAEGHFTTSDGVQLRYIEKGSGDPIVFVPGWTMPAEIFLPQIHHFSSRYRVIALDPRSHGDSEKVTEGHYSERMARDVKELIDHLQLQRPVLVGWSLSVPQLLSYVDQFGADKLRAVVLIDGFVKVTPEFFSFFPQFMKAFQVDRKKTTAAFVRSMYKKPQSEDYLQQITASSLKTPTNTAIALQVGNLARADWSGMFSKFATTPVLFAFEPQLQSQVDFVKEKFPAARVEVFEDAGHALFVDDADRFNATLQKLLDDTTIVSK